MSDLVNKMTLEEVLRAARSARDAILGKVGSGSYRDAGVEQIEQLKLILVLTGVDYHGRIEGDTFVPDARLADGGTVEAPGKTCERTRGRFAG